MIPLLGIRFLSFSQYCSLSSSTNFTFEDFELFLRKVPLVLTFTHIKMKMNFSNMWEIHFNVVCLMKGGNIITFICCSSRRGCWFWGDEDSEQYTNNNRSRRRRRGEDLLVVFDTTKNWYDGWVWGKHSTLPWRAGCVWIC